ncbi:MAG: hypothetical protein RI894_764 [Bacteroidota bacterium]|jgi:hypothetical protein
MNSILKNIPVFLGGLFLGGLVNMAIIMLSGHIIPPPDGADLTTEAGLKAAMHLLEPKHFIMPFFAHALGTFVSALFIAKFATSHQLAFALGAGAVTMIGGITAVSMLPSPVWFSILDIAGAYIPMAYLAAKLVLPKNEIETA